MKAMFMRMSKSAVLIAVIYLSLLIAACAGSPQVIINNDDKDKISHLSGTILINIMSSDYHDFAFRLPTMTMQEIAKGNVVREEKSGRSICEGSNFKNVWSKIRGKQSLDEEQFKIVFGRYDLSELYPLSFELFRNRHNNCDTKKTYKLKEINPIQPQKENYTKYDHTPPNFSINDQKTFAVYTYTKPALLIDLGSMTISNAFCNKPVYHPVWDKTGQYLAHVTTTPTSNRYDEMIAVADIKNASVIMDKRINKHIEETLVVRDESSGKMTFKQWNPSTRKLEESTNTDSLSNSERIDVADIAWNPSSDHIAVLTSKSRIGLWPWELLAAAAGHPISHNTFFLSIYDMTGKELLNQKVVSNVVNGRGSLVWTDEQITDPGLGR
jgi:hypothetical protein